MSEPVVRRQFLTLSAGLVAGICVGCTEDSDPPATVPVPTHPPLATVGNNLPTTIPKSLLVCSREELDTKLDVVSGSLPTDWYGHLFINTPLPWADGTHVFNGDGMLYRLSLSDQSVELRMRLLKTPCYYADIETKDTEHGFENAGLARISTSLGFRNQVNTSPVAMGKRLLVATDGGRPFEVDPVSLEVITPVGKQSEWPSSGGTLVGDRPFDLQLSAAHPFYDTHTSELFTLCYGLPQTNNQWLELIRWDGEGALERWKVVNEKKEAILITQSAHQFTLTEDYILLMECAVLFEGEQLFDSSKSRAQLPETILYIIKRSDLKGDGKEDGKSVVARKITIAREAAHITADYLNPDGKITIYLAHLSATDLSEWLRESDLQANNQQKVRQDLLGLFGCGTDIGWLGKHIIDAKEATLLDESVWVKDDEYTWSTLFYTHRGTMTSDHFEHLYWMSLGFHPELVTNRLIDLYRDYPYRTVPVDQLPTTERNPALFRTNTTNLQIEDGYKFPAGRIPTSPQFVPRKNSLADTDGYLICLVISDDTSTKGSSGDEFWVFDAANLAQGPLCRLAHSSLRLPFTLHTTWMETLEPRTSSYRISAREEYQDKVAKLSPELQQMFEKNIYPHFGG
jgi:carotenoid cleavage dioxygenase-like enzyme